MDINDALHLAAEVTDDPDEFLDLLEQLRRLRWSDGTPVIE